jgi:tetratricopeptide (TPR) repeat protein
MTTKSELRIDKALKLHEEAWKLEEQGDIAGASKLCRQVLRIFEQEEGPNSPDIANVLNDLADLERRLERFDKALALAQRAQDVLDALGRRFRGEVAAQVRGRTATILGTAYRETGEFSAARKHLNQALAVHRKQFGPESDQVASTENDLGVLCKYTARFDEGLRHYNSALNKLRAIHGEDSLPLGVIYHNIGGILHAAEDYKSAEGPGRKAWEISQAHLGPDHPRTIADAAAYAAILDGLGRFTESEPIYRRALKVFEKLYGPDNYEVAANLHNLGALKAATRKFAEAEKHYRRSLEIKRKLFGNNHPDVALTLNNLGSLLNDRGRHTEAAVLLKRAIAIYKKRVHAGHPHLAAAKTNLAIALHPR